MSSRISKQEEKEMKTLDEAEETKRIVVEEIKKLKERKKEKLSLEVNMMVIL